MPTLGEILYHPADIVTVEGGTGGVTKGDPVTIEAASTKSGIYIKVVPLTDDNVPCIGVAMDTIAEGDLGPILVSHPVVFLTGKATVTVGAWVCHGASGQVTDVSWTAGLSRELDLVGVAWKGVASATDVIPVQLMPCAFKYN